MAVLTFKKKKIELDSNDVSNLEYIKLQLGINEDIEAIRFLMNFFIRVDEAISKCYDELGE